MRGLSRLPLRLRFYRRRLGAWDWTFGVWMILGPPLAQRLFLGSIHWVFLGIFDALFLPSLFVGARLDGGYRKPSASTSTKERGTRTLGTGTTAGCSSTSKRGGLAAVSLDPTLLARVNSYTGLGSTGASKDGVDGGRTPLERAV